MFVVRDSQRSDDGSILVLDAGEAKGISVCSLDVISGSRYSAIVFTQRYGVSWCELSSRPQLMAAIGNMKHVRSLYVPVDLSPLWLTALLIKNPNTLVRIEFWSGISSGIATCRTVTEWLATFCTICNKLRRGRSILEISGAISDIPCALVERNRKVRTCVISAALAILRWATAVKGGGRDVGRLLMRAVWDTRFDDEWFPEPEQEKPPV